jgi:hypothetical protein
MPYINQEARNKLEHLIKTMHLTSIENAGELNYLLTQLVHTYLDQRTNKDYQGFNDVMGALEGCKLEIYRRYISKYEDQKIEQNGDVP